MNDTNFSVALRNLADEYYSQEISMEEYRRQRTILLDKIDAEFNGRKIATLTEEQNTTTDASFFMKTVAFFKNKNVDS